MNYDHLSIVLTLSHNIIQVLLRAWENTLNIKLRTKEKSFQPNEDTL